MLVHIVEHFPKGTIYNLIFPLQKYGHRLLYAPEDIKSIDELMRFPKETVFILHITGRWLDLFATIEKIVKYYRVALFLHTSPSYMEYQGREKSIDRIIMLYKLGVHVLVPCRSIQTQLEQRNIMSYIIQMGIPHISKEKEQNYLHEFFGKIITCCSENTPEYLYAKGIDYFERYITDNNLFSEALIVGDALIPNIQSKRFPHDEFLRILQHSKMYIQFSRFEAYNITAVESKQLKIPVVLLDAEGVYDNVRHGFVCKNYSEMESVANKVLLSKSSFAETAIDLNYKDSIFRETDLSFATELMRWVGTI